VQTDRRVVPRKLRPSRGCSDNNNNNIYAGAPRRVPTSESNAPGGALPQAGVALQSRLIPCTHGGAFVTGCPSDLSYPGHPPQRERAESGKEGLEHPAHVSVDPDPGDNPVPTMDPSGGDADPSVPGLLLSTLNPFNTVSCSS
jgi:hypothetical protein